MNQINQRRPQANWYRDAFDGMARRAKGVLLSVTCSIVMIAGVSAQERSEKQFSKYVDSKGNISLPEEFETTFVHLGSIAVAPKTGADVTELHATYTRAEDVKAFQKDGHFADGAILVKEVRSAKGEDLPTGHTRFAADVKIWFVMVKDGTGRFKDNDLWGDGWGWALFNANDRTKQVATDYRTDCRTCHVPAKGNDWIYTQCYPSLKKIDAKSKADVSTSETSPTKDLVARFPQWKEAIHLKGDLAKGRKYFESKTINTSLTCASCHSFDVRDTMSLDGDGLVRSGFPIFAAAHRTDIKHSGTGLVALGANVCVVHFMKGEPPGMTPQELADMNQFLQSGGNAKHATAKNVDYAHLKWTIPETLSGGDAKKGGALVMQTCISCHSVDGKNARVLDAAGKIGGGSFAAADLKKLALRIRNPEYKNNDEMPGYSDIRLSNQALLDILAWLTTK
ncbi:MAG: cytochrome c, class [Schlesneria sp.]|nr:cytochrome c, class [Schlesneria sp.]